MFSRRNLGLALALSAALAAGPLATRAGAGNGLGGSAEGLWDLPESERQPGWLGGWLISAESGEARFYFAALLEERIGPPLETRFGAIYGVLSDLKAPAEEPAYYVEGPWRGLRSGFRGTWSATIYSIETWEAVGEMAGDFTDPAPYTVGDYGAFTGRWRLVP